MKRMGKEVKKDTVVLSGAAGAPGIVIGPASVYHRRRPSVSTSPVDDSLVQEQVDDFHKARIQAEEELKSILEGRRESDATDIVRTQIEMLRDPELIKRVEAEINNRNSQADAAIETVFDTYLSAFRKNNSSAAEKRSVDIADIRDRLLQIIHNYESEEIAEDSIVVASDLSPREVIECAERNIRGIVMDHGGRNSHAAIIARSMDVPTVLGLRDASSEIKAGDVLIVDGESGKVIVNPDEDSRDRYRERIAEQQRAALNFESICKQPNSTKDEEPFCLRANIEFAEELEMADKYRAEGVGLLRTESIYMRRKHFDDSENQEHYYSEILEHTKPEPVTIRLFDAGGDKFFEDSETEQNPFLGWRGVRMLLDEQEMLKRQLSAICRTAGRFPGRIQVLVPMVSDIEQLQAVGEMLDSVQRKLKDKGVETDDQLRLGVMVEVPNVAMQADLFAEYSDFLSIGTNDLTQYVLAVDRGNERISHLYDQRHPMIWRLIGEVSEAAQRLQTPLSICGELASDPVAACCLMGLGISELSMTPAALPAVKKALRTHTLKEMKELAKRVRACRTIAEVDETFSKWKK